MTITAVHSWAKLFPKKNYVNLSAKDFLHFSPAKLEKEITLRQFTLRQLSYVTDLLLVFVLLVKKNYESIQKSLAQIRSHTYIFFLGNNE